MSEIERLEFKNPKNWEKTGKWGDGFIFIHKIKKISVIIDIELKSDGYSWIHVSVSHKARIPRQKEMLLVKNDFIGKDKYAYSVWPPEKYYVDIHKNCLHLWARISKNNGQVLPEFSGEIEGIGRSI